MNGEIHASASLSPENPVTNFIGNGMDPRLCLNASGLKMVEIGCSIFLTSAVDGHEW